MSLRVYAALTWLCARIAPRDASCLRPPETDGGLTANQVDVLKRLYGMRNELQHASPGVQAGEALRRHLAPHRRRSAALQRATSNGCNSRHIYHLKIASLELRRLSRVGQYDA